MFRKVGSLKFVWLVIVIIGVVVELLVVIYQDTAICKERKVITETMMKIGISPNLVWLTFWEWNLIVVEPVPPNLYISPFSNSLIPNPPPTHKYFYNASPCVCYLKCAHSVAVDMETLRKQGQAHFTQVLKYLGVELGRIWITNYYQF